MSGSPSPSWKVPEALPLGKVAEHPSPSVRAMRFMAEMSQRVGFVFGQAFVHSKADPVCVDMIVDSLDRLQTFLPKSQALVSLKLFIQLRRDGPFTLADSFKVTKLCCILCDETTSAVVLNNSSSSDSDSDSNPGSIYDSHRLN